MAAASGDAQACPAWEESIGAAAAGWLSAREAAHLTRHTAACRSCAVELSALMGLGALLREQRGRPQVSRPSMRRRW